MDSTWWSLSEEAPSTSCWPCPWLWLSMAACELGRRGSEIRAELCCAHQRRLREVLVRIEVGRGAQVGHRSATLWKAQSRYECRQRARRSKRRAGGGVGRRGRRERTQLDSIKLRVRDDTAGEGWLPATRRHTRASAPVKREGGLNPRSF